MLQLQCIQVINAAESVTHFRFRIDIQCDNEMFSPGQYMTLELPIDGKLFYRSYTLTSSRADWRNGEIQITVKALGGGRCSAWLRQSLQPGMQLKASLPAGEFCERQLEPHGHLLMLAAGSGITPMYAMLKEWAETGVLQQRSIHLVYSNRSASDTIFSDELRLIGSQSPRLKNHFLYSRSAEPSRLSRTWLQQLCPDLASSTVLICGPADYMQDACTMALSLGARREFLHMECFQIAATSHPVLNAGGNYRLRFTGHPEQIVTLGNETLLEIAEINGLNISSSCRQGICGECRVRVDGSCHMAEEIRAAHPDLAPDEVLACCAYPVDALVVVSETEN